MKTPSDQTIAEIKGYLGTDHEKKSVDGWAAGLGLEKDMLQGLQDGQFSKSSAPSQEQQLAEEAKTAEAERKKAAAKAKQKAKPQKPFEFGSVWAALQPELNEWGSKLQTRSEQMISKVEDVLKDVFANETHYHKMALTNVACRPGFLIGKLFKFVTPC